MVPVDIVQIDIQQESIAVFSHNGQGAIDLPAW